MGFKIYCYFNNTLGDKGIISNMALSISYFYFPYIYPIIHPSFFHCYKFESHLIHTQYEFFSEFESHFQPPEIFFHTLFMILMPLELTVYYLIYSCLMFLFPVSL